jgi:predicted AAA+ superfamily ATPase
VDISKEILRQVLLEQRKGFLRKGAGVQREALGIVEEKLRLPHVLVITGMRRCGKSTLLRQIAQKFYKDEEFFYLNFEDERLMDFPAESFQVILETQLELFGEKKVFMIDEIQQNEGFEMYVRRLGDVGYKFIITGSNARLLSSEISTKLTGRHTDISLYPFSFREYLRFKDMDIAPDDIYLAEKKAVIRKEFEHFLLQGSMPEFTIYQDDEILFRTYEDIIYKDIAVRYGITMVKPMRDLYHYLVSNICRPFSYRTLTKVSGIESPVTIKNYIHHLEQTYFIKQISKFDYSLKKQLINNKKVYVIDNAFFQKISFQYSGNKGWLLENLVAGELFKSGEVYYHQDKQSCDFILKKMQGFEAYQVVFEMNEDSREREIKGLLEAMDYLGLPSGTIITYDEEGELDKDGRHIHLLPCWKWLLRSEE